MRYILDPRFGHQIDSRRNYLFDVFHLYFFPISKSASGNLRDAIALLSFPITSEPDTCIIYGHNDFVASILQNCVSDIPERKIYIISCAKKYRSKYSIKGKYVYIVPQTSNCVYTYDGEDFGFDFDITDAELNLYNCPKNTISQKLHSVFIPI